MRAVGRNTFTPSSLRDVATKAIKGKVYIRDVNSKERRTKDIAIDMTAFRKTPLGVFLNKPSSIFLTSSQMGDKQEFLLS